MRVAVLGIGEAGSLFAADLVASGATVAAYDPAPVRTPPGVDRHIDPEGAVAGAGLVLALTASTDARLALTQALPAIPVGTLYADLSTSAPDVKRDLAALAAHAGLEFADVALMSIVPGHGLRTPALVSGPGARRYVDVMTPLDVPVDVVGDRAGDAAARKLLRSIVMKGLAAVVIEAVRAAEAADLGPWLWENLVQEISTADERMLVRLVTGTRTHAERRLAEMEACRALLDALGVDPVMTRSTVEALRRVPADGVPVVPPPRPDAAG
jgi:3-hydroxyisobutyrate dehydrogenase